MSGEPAHDYPDPRRRMLITLSALLATMMVTIDTTIANVALPHMQSSLMASPEEVVWVLTSYIIAAAIGTPLSGWLATQFGRKRTMFVSVLGFTLSSMACGLANSLEAEVIARLLQGLSGAALIPLGQATLLDAYPPKLHARAMAYFAAGSMLGPLLGPPLGGVLTDAMSWRWVFFINLPVGIAAAAGIWFFLEEDRDRVKQRFDLFGFASISLAIGAFQLMLDRGQQVDWFQSAEIWLEAGIALLATWIAGVHMFTARNTFIKPALFTNRNFVVGCVVNIVMGCVGFGVMPTLTTLLQRQLGYSPTLAGELSLPRGITCTIAMVLVPWLVHRFDARIPLVVGLVITAMGLFMHAAINTYVDPMTLILAGAVQGFGLGLLFVPLTLIAFATLPADLRNEGSAMFNLARNMGMAVSVSLLQRNLLIDQAANHARLTETVRPDSPVLQWRMPDLDFGSQAAMTQLNRWITHQADMFAYLNIFEMMGYVSLFLIGVLVFVRIPRNAAPAPPVILD